MAKINNDKEFIKEANELIDGFGEPKEIAQVIDDLIFSYVELSVNRGDCLADYHWNTVSTARQIRDLFSSIKCD